MVFGQITAYTDQAGNVKHPKCMFACIVFSEAGFKNVGFKIFQVNCYVRGSL